MASLLLSPWSLGCTGRDQTDARVSDGNGPSTRPTVVVSIFPVADLVRFLGGDAVEVETLLPPRVSPSTFEPTARQMARLSGASAYIIMGGGMDAWAERMAHPSARVVRLTEGMALLGGHAHEGHPDTGNPHVWLDPVRVRDDLLPVITAVLIEVAPASADAVHRREAALSDSLTALDAEIRVALSGVSPRAFISTHAAWSYFAERYQLEEIGSVYESPGREPSARHLTTLIADARGKRVQAVFIEPQLGEMGARTVASELGLGVHLLDPQGGEGEAERGGYLALMRFNMRQFASGLSGSP